ncbi:MAG TPA: hypothetical protein VFM50_00910 [Nocardioidaceae bacterium]|nr:hypothetical protein [Nocardioidaceae bacterium]
MSPLSPVVLIAAALVSSPALWGGLVEQTTPMSVALTRYLLCIVLCWAALGLVVTLVGPPPRPERAESAGTGGTGGTEAGGRAESSAGAGSPESTNSSGSTDSSGSTAGASRETAGSQAR